MPFLKGPAGRVGNHGAMSSGGSTTTPATPAAAAPVAPTIDQVVANIFTRFDANTDGSITSAELLAVLDPTGTHTVRADAVAKLVAQLDTTVDGKLTKAEVKAGVTALDTNGNGTLDRADHAAAATGTPPLMGLLLGRGGHGHGGPSHDGTPPAPQAIADVVTSVFTVVDKDASAGISLSELLAAVDPSGTHTHRTTAATTLFGKIDTDTDGSLTTTELKAYLTALDTDADGLLEHADLAPGPTDHSAPELIGVLLHVIETHGPGS